VEGLCARTGVVVDFAWAAGKVRSIVLHARHDTSFTISYNGTSQAVSLKKGESKPLDL